MKTVMDRFLNYVTYDTKSNPESLTTPSTESQLLFGDILIEELHELGLTEIEKDENGYIYATLPGNVEHDVPVIAFISHMDTSPDFSGTNVNPQVVDYAGGDIVLNKEKNIVLSPTDFPSLNQYVGQTLITTDGTTLLGADDKAGIAEIMTAVSQIIKNKTPHGKVEVIFSPDEETGHGMDNVPLNLIQSKKAYTVDGGHLGELEIECFNAYKSEITFTGKSKHTGNARPDMVNAISMVASFLQNLPKNQAPETTDKKMGFFAPMTVEGTIESAKTCVFLRDFDKNGMEKRKKLIENLANMTAELFGGKVSFTHTFQYENMKEKIDGKPSVVEDLVRAYKKAGVEPNFVPIRGGTDGSRLTEMGIPTPNIFTGGHNYHSRTEWASLEQMEKATEILINLIED